MKIGSKAMNTEPSRSRLRRLFCALAGGLGMTIGAGTITLPVASAQTSDYQPTGNAPAAWQQFAEQVQLRFRERLATEDGSVRQLNRLLEERRAIDSAPLNVLVKVWISPVGAVERLEFDTLDPEVASNLRAILIGSSLHALPPQNMLQPMHLMLSLGQAN